MITAIAAAAAIALSAPAEVHKVVLQPGAIATVTSSFGDPDEEITIGVRRAKSRWLDPINTSGRVVVWPRPRFTVVAWAQTNDLMRLTIISTAHRRQRLVVRFER